MSSLRNLLVIICNFIFCRLSAPKNILSNYMLNILAISHQKNLSTNYVRNKFVCIDSDQKILLRDFHRIFHFVTMLEVPNKIKT